jgi:FkbM family methyltransferase
MMKSLFFRLFNRQEFQPLFEKIHSYSLVMQNYWNGAHFEKSGELFLLKLIKNKLDGSSVVFDVGANIGKYALELSKENGFIQKIYCFEPVTKTFEILRETTAGCSKIECVKVGFGSKESEVEIFIEKDGSGLNSLYDNNPLTTYNKTEKIKIETIDGFASAHNIGKIDFLKIDVEGHELEVLKGAHGMLKNQHIKMIQFEMGECNIASRTFFYDFYQILNKDYNLYRILPTGLRKIDGYSPIKEVFACINYVAILKKFDGP